MEAYTSFAEVYDLFMDNVPYDKWGQYIIEALKAAGIEEGTIVDLGCGTGKITRILAEAGYDMIGIDYSMEMLQIAREKEYEEWEDVQTYDEEELEEYEPGILYLWQDMCELELMEPVDAIYSACDCLNYVLEEESVSQVFSHVAEYLKAGGLFIFDVNTPYKYEKVLKDNTFAENREEGSFIWENYFDKETGINQYDLTLFIKEGEQYTKYEEQHLQKSYSIELIQKLLEKAGLSILGIYDEYSKNPARMDSEKITIIARK